MSAYLAEHFHYLLMASIRSGDALLKQLWVFSRLRAFLVDLISLAHSSWVSPRRWIQYSANFYESNSPVFGSKASRRKSQFNCIVVHKIFIVVAVARDCQCKWQTCWWSTPSDIEIYRSDIRLWTSDVTANASQLCIIHTVCIWRCSGDARPNLKLRVSFEKPKSQVHLNFKSIQAPATPVIGRQKQPFRLHFVFKLAEDARHR